MSAEQPPMSEESKLDMEAVDGAPEAAHAESTASPRPVNKTDCRVPRVDGGDRPQLLRYMPDAPHASSKPEAAGFGGEHPSCPQCGCPARPAVLMFEDHRWRPNSMSRRFEAWLKAVKSLAQERLESRKSALRVVILELGAGTSTPAVRNTSERALEALSEKGADAWLVRVNSSAPGPDVRLRGGPLDHRVISIKTRSLAMLQSLEALLPASFTGDAMSLPAKVLGSNLRDLLEDVDLERTSVGQICAKLEQRLGFEEGSLKARREELVELLQSEVQRRCRSDGDCCAEDAEPEGPLADAPTIAQIDVSSANDGTEPTDLHDDDGGAEASNGLCEPGSGSILVNEREGVSQPPLKRQRNEDCP